MKLDKETREALIGLLNIFASRLQQKQSFVWTDDETLIAIVRLAFVYVTFDLECTRRELELCKSLLKEDYKIN